MNLFSIVIPSYNRPDLLARLLESISYQTTRDFEVFVVDDASLDKESYERIVEKFSHYIPVHYLRNDKNRGAQYSRNRGIAESTGKLIAFVDDDDEWLPEKLERQAAIFKAGSERLGLVYSWADAVGENGTVLHQYRAVHRGDTLAELLDTCFIPSPTVVIPRLTIQNVGEFDESLPSCQDWDMWVRIIEAGYDIDVAKEVLALHHKHGRASIGTSNRSLDGFFQFYTKHRKLYIKMRMSKDLSEKFRWLAYQATQINNHELTGKSLRFSVSLWRRNLKAWIRFGQFTLGR